MCLETHGTVCEWDGDKLTAWVSTQAVHGSRDNYAMALGIPQANVRVITQYMGGGFGSKFTPVRGGHHLRAAGQGRRRAGQADARPERGTPRQREPSVGHRARSGRRVSNN